MIFLAATKDTGDEPDHDKFVEDRGGGRDESAEESNTRKLKRRAGTIWRVLTEPLVILGLTVLVLVFGRGYLRRRAERLRRQREEAEREQTNGDA